MQHMSATLKKGRVAVLALSLLMAVGFGSAAAASPEVGFTECDAVDCTRGYAAQVRLAPFLDLSPAYGDYISTGSLDIGFVE